MSDNISHNNTSLSIDVIIKEGRDLIPEGFSMFSSQKEGTSDLYVNLSLDGTHYGTTRVEKNTLKPKWNYQVPIITLDTDKANHIFSDDSTYVRTYVRSTGGVLKFEVFDSDIIKDDPMGVVNVPLQSFLTNPKDVTF